MPDTRFDSESEHILFIGDPNLGDEGYRYFSGFFPDAKKLIWKKGADKTGVRRVLRFQAWLFTVSFYSDFIFSPSDFDFLGLPLNIHPALPVLRGIGHDHVPRIEGHEEPGSTLHFINRPSGNNVDPESDVDSGGIVMLRKRKLDPNATYGDIRMLNQQIALEMLAALCEQMHSWGCVETARRELNAETAAYVEAFLVRRQMATWRL